MPWQRGSNSVGISLVWRRPSRTHCWGKKAGDWPYFGRTGDVGGGLKKFGRTSKPAKSGKENWWSRSGSNRRPPQCHCGALPTELLPHACRRGTGTAKGPGWGPFHSGGPPYVKGTRATVKAAVFREAWRSGARHGQAQGDPSVGKGHGGTAHGSHSDRNVRRGETARVAVVRSRLRRRRRPLRRS